MNNAKVTIESLVPDLDFKSTPHFKETKYSARTLGSRLLNLKRVSRLPNSSRRYLLGDPIRLIDWRAYARNDQLIVREIRDEASSRISICLDLSETMNWPEQSTKKQEIAIRTAYHLLYSHLNVGDLVCFLIWFQDRNQPAHQIYFKSTKEVLQSFNSIMKLGFNTSDLNKLCVARRHHNLTYDTGYLISDMIGREDFSWFFQMNRNPKLKHILSSLELDLEWVNESTTYFDHEMTKKEYLGVSLKKNKSYLDRLQQWQISLKDDFRKAGGSYQLLNDKTILEDYFVNIFV